jgi:glycosidase
MGANRRKPKHWLTSLGVIFVLLAGHTSIQVEQAQAADVFSIVPALNGKPDSTRTSLEFGTMAVGQKKSDNFIINNNGDRALVFFVFARFSYLSEDGQTRLIASTDSEPLGMAAWARLGAQKAASVNVSVSPGKSALVPLELTVPKDAFPGAHTAAVLVQAISGTGQVVVGKRVALNMTATISGSLRPAVNPTWINDSVFYELNVRQFSATRNFTGAAARISQLKTLGVEAIVLNPIFPIGKSRMVGTLGSVFAPTDISKVNSSLGTSTSFNSFVKSAQAAGIKVILTVPLDNVAVDHPWVVNQPNWFLRDANYDLQAVDSKPFLATLNYQQEELQLNVIKSLTSWVTVSGVDGFVFTGATKVPVDFLNRLTFQLQRNKSLLIGTTDDLEASYFTNSLTFTYSDKLRDFLKPLSLGTQVKTTLGKNLTTEAAVYKSPAFSLNYLSNYETMEARTTETATFGAALGTAAALSFTLPGAPVIFQGQEVGSIKILKPYDSDFIVWPSKNPASYALYQKLIKLKKLNGALHNANFGSPVVSITTSSNSVYAFRRTSSASNVIVVVNLSRRSVTARISPSATGTMFRFTDGRSVSMRATGFELTLPALGYEIYTRSAVR